METWAVTKKQWTEAELVHPVEQMKLLRWEPLEYFLFESSLANQDPSPMSDGESDVMDDLSLWFHDYVHLHREDFSVVGKFPDLSGLPKKKLRYTKKVRSLFTQDPELRSKFWEGDELRIG